MMCDATWLKAQVLVRVISSICHALESLFVLSLFLHLVLFRVFLLSLLLLPEPGLVPFPFHVDLIEARPHWHSAK